MAALTELKNSDEFEHPVKAWIDLVEACHIEDADLRNKAVMNYLNLAKNSHWTHQLWEREVDQYEDVDYVGGEQDGSDTESYDDDGSEYPQQEVGEDIVM